MLLLPADVALAHREYRLGLDLEPYTLRQRTEWEKLINVILSAKCRCDPVDLVDVAMRSENVGPSNT